MSVVDCIEYMEDWYWVSRSYWICAGLQNIGKTCTGSEVYCILYRGLVLGL